jgi:hypothetical protein
MSKVITVKRRAFRNGHDQYVATTTSGLKSSYKPTGAETEDVYWQAAKALAATLKWEYKFQEGQLDEETRVFVPIDPDKTRG